MKTLVVKGSGGGGLGDRIRAALVGCLYAELTERAIFVDWSDGVYGLPGLNSFNDLFQIHGLEVLDRAPQRADTNPVAWSERLTCSMDQVWNEDGNTRWDRADAISRYSFDLSNLSHPESVLVMWDFDQLEVLRPHLAPEQRDLDAEGLLTMAYRRFLSPAADLDLEVSNCLKDVDGPTIGLHARATRESWVQKGYISLSTYYRALDRLLTKTNAVRIIVCTDNSDIEGELMKRYPEAWSRKKWFPKPGESVHLNSACPDKLQSAKDALVDMILLARCDWLITVQNSSFSMLSRIMSSVPSSHHVQLSPSISLKSRIERKLRGYLRSFRKAY